MHEFFGYRFYEWWAGLGRTLQAVIAAAVFTAGAFLAWLVPADGFLWIPLLVAGAVLAIATLLCR